MFRNDIRNAVIVAYGRNRRGKLLGGASSAGTVPLRTFHWTMRVRPPARTAISGCRCSCSCPISSLRWQRSSANSLAFVCSLTICSKSSTLIKSYRKSWVKSTRPLTLMWQRSGTSNSMEWASKRNGWQNHRPQEKTVRGCSLRNYI